MKTIVKLSRGTRETVYDPVDLPFIPEGAIMATPHAASCRVIISCVDISLAEGPVQTLVVQ
jgi:hypothetical protein